MEFIYPNWSAPNNVHAFCTTRQGGVSKGAFASLNLGAHVGDSELDVAKNRQILQRYAHLPQPPLYLTQTHSTKVLTLPINGVNSKLEADGSYSSTENTVCLVMTADCLPILFCNRNGTEVGATHAGWRGLCYGILENTVAKFRTPPSEIMAWLAPAISQSAFQIGAEVREEFLLEYEQNYGKLWQNSEGFHLNLHSHLTFEQGKLQLEGCFKADEHEEGKFRADLYAIAHQRLQALGITQIYGGNYCTFSQAEKFFSYRREQQTGRMASLIWFTHK